MKPALRPAFASFNRRSALKLGAGAVAASALGAPGILRAQSGPIRIGHLTPMTGFLGTLGGWAVEGAKMAAEEINAAGGINGRMIELMSEDSINPENGATKAQRMLEHSQSPPTANIPKADGTGIIYRQPCPVRAENHHSNR